MSRPRKPTALKLLHGDDKNQPGRINVREPKPHGVVAPPEWLSRNAKLIWNDIAPDMERVGVLTHWDVPMFAELCEALVIVRAARSSAAREILGQIQVLQGAASPTTAYLKAMQIALQLSARFGITPADRTRLAMPETTRRGGTDDLLSG